MAIIDYAIIEMRELQSFLCHKLMRFTHLASRRGLPVYISSTGVDRAFFSPASMRLDNSLLARAHCAAQSNDEQQGHQSHKPTYKEAFK